MLSRRIAPGFVVAGSALLMVALLLFVYFITYRPEQQHPEYEAQIDNPARAASTPNDEGAIKVQTIKSKTTPQRQFQHGGAAPQTVEKKPGIFRRFLNFLKRLFGGGKKRGGASPHPFLAGLQASSSSIVLPCPEGTISESCAADNNKIQLTAIVLDADKEKLRYGWSVTGGKLTGDGYLVSWDLSGLPNGTYTAMVSASNGATRIERSVSVTVVDCHDCRPTTTPLCPSVSVTSPESVAEGHPITFVASVSGEFPGITYNWSVSNGMITGGNRTPSVTVDSRGVGENTITATVSLGGGPPTCSDSNGSSTTAVHVQGSAKNPIRFAVFDATNFNDEQARLDNFAVELLNNPASKGAIIAYGNCEGEGRDHAAATKDYLVSRRGLESARIVSIDGGCREQRGVELWLVPRGAALPEPRGSTACPICSITIGIPEDKKLATLTGRLIDKNGDALADATVTLIGAGKFKRVVKSNTSGGFEFHDLPAGTYSLEISAPGHGTRRVEGLEVKEGVYVLPEPIQVFEREVSTRFKLRDVIRIGYPDHFIESPAGEITFEWNREPRETEVVTSQTNTNGRINIVDRPPPVPGGTPDVPVVEARGRQYTAYAKVTLIPDGLTVTSTPLEAEQSLAPKHVVWSWKVKPANMNAPLAAFRFHIDLVWRGEGLEEKTDSYDWPQTFVAKVGLPGSVKVAKYGSATFALVGFLTVGWGLRKQKLLATEPVTAGHSMSAPAREDVAKDEVAEDVSSSVFAPRRAAAGEGFLVQVFAHLPGEDPAGLTGKATEAQAGAEKVGGDLLDEKVKRGTTLTFTLSMKGLEIDEPQQSRVWRGRTIQIQFGVTVPKDFQPGSMLGLLVVSADTIPIGHFRFAFQVVEPGGYQAETPSYIGALTRYQHAFISYAHEDRAEVLKRVQMLNLMKEKFFQDFISLEPGKPWEPAIREAIDHSDVVFLFWSKAASTSTEVKKEILYAVARHAGDESAAPAILPVIIEGPPPPAPPDELKFLQFDDKFSYWIFAAQATDHHEGS